MVRLSAPAQRRLLGLLAALLLLMQPLALLHALSHVPHAHGPWHDHRAQAAQAPEHAAAGAVYMAHADMAHADGAHAGQAQAPVDDAHADDGHCLHCLALNALAHALPVLAPGLALLPLAQAPGLAPRTAAAGGVAAGYHARGPPILA